MVEDITLCVTLGGRPDLLRRTLSSLLAGGQKFAAAVFINDIGDRASTELAQQILPDAKIITHSTRQGQAKSIDEMYAEVATPLIFHCEDDWEFDRVPFMDHCRDVLDGMTGITMVTVRQTRCQIPVGSSATFEDYVGGAVPEKVGETWAVKKKRRGNSPWGAFTFNPSLLRRQTWVELGGYEQYRTEDVISAECWKRGLTSAQLLPGICFHIGQDRHVNDPSNPSADVKGYRNIASQVKSYVRRVLA